MIDNEIFLIRNQSGYILYAPLARFSARINNDCAEAVLRKQRGIAALPEEKAIIEYLSSFGIFNKAEPPVKKRLKPTEVTLFPSDGCSLKCVYCYADCGGTKHIMPLNTGKAAIDLVFNNALEQNVSPVAVKFHGNGEPFTAFDTVKELSRYAREKSEETGVPVTLIAVSNGYWSDDILSWVTDEIDETAISFDGIKSVQNAQRPTVSGKESFSVVDRTLRELNRRRKAFGIKVTVTAKSVDSIVDTARYVSEAYPECGWLQFEPVWNVGRFSGAEDGETYFDRFINGYIQADRQFGGRLRLMYATANINELRLSGCGVPDGQFVVTPQGLVTSCYEVYDRGDTRSDVYIYGKYNGINGFCFDADKLDLLRRYTVSNMPYCKDCYCKYHCAGDCPAKLLSTNSPQAFKGSDRCKVTRAITKYLIEKQLS